MPTDFRSDILETLEALRGTVVDVAKRRGDPTWRETLLSALHTGPIALTKTLPWLVRAREGRDESLVRMLGENARVDPDGLAIEMDDEQLTWAELDEEAGRIASVLSSEGVRAGDVVVLMGENSPRFLSALFGISRLGATASLINFHLDGVPLGHAMRSSNARVGLVQQSFVERVTELGDTGLEKIIGFDRGELEERAARAHDSRARARLDAASDFVYIFTSGTTGLPKPCRVTHARSVLAGAAFGQLLFEFRPGDKLYCVLPLYHSSALLIGTGACVMTRTPLALRRSFSARAFWPDVQRYRATAMLYIGELCRYLVNSDPSELERENPLRVAVGNGMRSDVWEEFARRFQVASIREFYSATEAPGLIANLTGKVGSIGHVPFRRLGALRLARYDVERDELVRDAEGHCVLCGPGEVGELLIRLKDTPRTALGEFRGYTDTAATEKKQLRDVFKPGDRYFRSGDLMRFDENDYFYFVDRIGDTYRWKGENVSTAEVAEVISVAKGVRSATVSSVPVPGAEGQAGLAALEIDGEFDPASFWQAAQGLPGYAQPRFVRVLPRLSTTGTFKIQKMELRTGGVDPNRVDDPLFVRVDDGYVRLTPDLWTDIVEGRFRL
ncbi:MAG: AMP-binding protein [Polyangiaceae bacterium]